MSSLTSRILEIYESGNVQLAEENAEKLAKQIEHKRKKLETIMTNFRQMENQHLIIQTTLSHTTRLGNLLSEDNEGLSFNLSFLKDNKNIIKEGETAQAIISNAYQAYEIIMEITALLGYNNHKVEMVLIHATKTKYYRLNTQLTPDQMNSYLYLELTKTGLALRIKTAQMRKNIIEFNEKFNKKNIQIIQNHYRGFITPFVTYAKNSATGWKYNMGVMIEAFERHWEMLGHSISKPNEFFKADYGSEGDRWLLYRLSSGSDPFYTGADTEFAQVKNTNASILSNLNTLLNSMQAILKLLNSKTLSQEQLQLYRKAFTQKKPDIGNMIKQIETVTHEEVSEELQEYIRNHY